MVMLFYLVKNQELIYKNNGLDAFIEHEKLNKDNPLEMGPFAKLLLTIAKIQAKFPTHKSPIRTALVTANQLQLTKEL